MMEDQSSAQSTMIKKKFHIQNQKLQTYVQTAIKKSHVKQFVNKKGRVSQNLIGQPSSNQNRNMNQHLFNLKNSCNNLVKDITNKQNQSVKLKDQTVFTSQKVKQLQTQRQKLQQKIKKLSTDTQNVLMKKQSTLHTYKTYQNILVRMKKDQITNQIKTNTLQKQLIIMEKQIKQLENKIYSLKQYEQLSVKGVKQAQIQTLKSSSIRQRKVNELNNTLQQKKIVQLKKMQRQNQTNSIQQMAAGDLQDADLIRMKRFLQVQLFLKCLLKNKMQLLKDQYEPYELAFMQIKSQTCVKDAISLKSEFYNFEANYHERTTWIKNLEQETLKLESEKKQLENDYMKLKQFQMDIYEQYQDKKNKNNHSKNQNVDKDTFNIHFLNHQLTMMKVQQWINFQSNRINSNTSKCSLANFKAISNHNLTQNNNDKTLNTASFNKICDYLLNKKKTQQSKSQKEDQLITLEEEGKKEQNKQEKPQCKSEEGLCQQKNDVQGQK